jgi:hypothetical protein
MTEKKSTDFNKCTSVESVVKMGNVTYRVLSIFEGEKNVGEILKNLAVRKAKQLIG